MSARWDDKMAIIGTEFESKTVVDRSWSDRVERLFMAQKSRDNWCRRQVLFSWMVDSGFGAEAGRAAHHSQTQRQPPDPRERGRATTISVYESAAAALIGKYDLL